MGVSSKQYKQSAEEAPSNVAINIHVDVMQRGAAVDLLCCRTAGEVSVWGLSGSDGWTAALEFVVKGSEQLSPSRCSEESETDSSRTSSSRCEDKKVFLLPESGGTNVVCG